MSAPAAGPTIAAEEATLVEIARDFGSAKVRLFRDEHDRLLFSCSCLGINYLVTQRLRRYCASIALLNRTLTP